MLVSTIWSVFFLSAGASLLSWGACKADALCLSWNGTIGVCFFLWIAYGITAVVAGLDLRAQIQALKGVPPGIAARESSVSVISRFGPCAEGCWGAPLGSTHARTVPAALFGACHLQLANVLVPCCPSANKTHRQGLACVLTTCPAVFCAVCPAAGTPTKSGNGSKPGTPTKSSQSASKLTANGTAAAQTGADAV